MATNLSPKHLSLLEDLVKIYGLDDEFISTELSVFEELVRNDSFSDKNIRVIKQIIVNLQNISDSILQVVELDKNSSDTAEKNIFFKIKCDLVLARTAYCYKLRDVILQVKVKKIKYQMARQASVANFFYVFSRETLGFKDKISPEEFLISAVSRYVVFYQEDGVYIKVANPFNREREKRSQYRQAIKLVEKDGRPVKGFDRPESPNYAMLQALTKGNYVSYPSGRKDIGQIAMPYKISDKVAAIYFIKGRDLLEQIEDQDKLERKNNLIRKIVSRANLYTEKIVRDLIMEEIVIKLRLSPTLDYFFDNVQNIMDVLFLKRISLSFRAVGDLDVLNKKYTREQGWSITLLSPNRKDEQEHIYHMEKQSEDVFFNDYRPSQDNYYSWQPIEIHNKKINEKIKNLLHVDLESFYPGQFSDQNLVRILNRLFMNFSGLIYEISQNNELSLNSFYEQQKILAQKEIESIRQAQQVYLDISKTNIFNRAYLEKQLTQIFSELKQTPQPVSFIMLDIDHFKKINDTYGHKVGDIVLDSLTEAVAGVEGVYGQKKIIKMIQEANIYEQVLANWQRENLIADNFSDQKQEIISVIREETLKNNISNLEEIKELINQPLYKRVFARWGGEEFMLILPGVDEQEALEIARQIATNIKNKEYILPKYKFNITATLGLLTKPAGNNTLTIDKCFQRVDDALYAGKLNGRDRVMVYNKTNEKIIKKAGLQRHNAEKSIPDKP